MRRRTLQDIDQNVALGLARYRRTIKKLLRPHIEQYVATIGLKTASAQFEHDVAEALFWCVALGGVSWKRYSDIRKEMSHISRASVAAVKSLDQLRGALRELTPGYRELLESHLELTGKIAIGLVAKQAPWFYALSLVGRQADTFAKNLRHADKGGAPKMFAFNMLVSGLKRAFERAKGRAAKVTWHQHREQYEGPFVSLVEAVLPLASSLAKAVERPMQYPVSQKSRGKYIYKATRTGASKTKPRRVMA